MDKTDPRKEEAFAGMLVFFEELEAATGQNFLEHDRLTKAAWSLYETGLAHGKGESALSLTSSRK